MSAPACAPVAEPLPAPVHAPLATAAMDTAGVPLFAAAMLDPGEAIIGVWRPSPWFIPLRSARLVVIIAAITVLAASAAGASGLEWTSIILQTGAVLIVAEVIWVMSDWLSRAYVLTDRRVFRRRGLLTPTVYQVELPLLRRVDVAQSFPARILGVGTVVFSKENQGGFDAAWVLAPRPHELRQLVLDTKQRYRR